MQNIITRAIASELFANNVREMLECRPRETMTVARERGGGEHLRPGGPPWQGDIAGAGRAEAAGVAGGME